MSSASRQLGMGVRLQRTRRRWTLDDLSPLVGMNRSTLSETERGVRTTSIDEMIRFCQVFECSLSDLLAELDPPDREALRI